MHWLVLLTLGGDVLPKDGYQTAIASVAVLVGVIINAQIFGELALIFRQLNKPAKAFQSKLAIINTAMIHLELPFDMQQSVRHELFQ